MTTEYVMVFPTSLLHELGYFQGVCEDVYPRFDKFTDKRHTSYRPRDEVETDPNFKQLIPYCIIVYGDKILYYTRGKKQGEKRLRGKRSIGVGGHISSVDGAKGYPYDIAMYRELGEELQLFTSFSSECVALVNDDSNEVGKVHLGVVHLVTLAAQNVKAREDGILDLGFATLDELRRDREEFETWSQLCIDSTLLEDLQKGRH